MPADHSQTPQAGLPPAGTAGDRSHIPLGLFSIATGAVTGTAAWGYGLGTLREMGPGFIPFVVSGLLMLLGGLTILRRGADLPPDAATVPLLSPAERRRERAEVLRVAASVLGGLTLFGLMLEPAGLPLSVFVLVVVASLAHPGPRPGPVLALAAGMAVFSTLVFVTLLKVQVGIWPAVF